MPRFYNEAAVQSGLPVFVSESDGMEGTATGPFNPVAWQEYLDYLKAKGLKWIAWPLPGKNETCSILQKTVSSTGPWQDADLKESGLKTRAYLKWHNTGKWPLPY